MKLIDDYTDPLAYYALGLGKSVNSQKSYYHFERKLDKIFPTDVRKLFLGTMPFTVSSSATYKAIYASQGFLEKNDKIPC